MPATDANNNKNGFLRSITMSTVDRSYTAAIVAYIDTFSEYTGRAVSWLCLLMVLLSCLIVVLRYGFNIGSVALQESLTYLHATVFLLGAAYTLKNDGHVRVDIFYRGYTERGKAWVNALGSLVFLLPMSLILLLSGWDYALRSWEILEGSPHADGIPALFLLKSLIPLSAATLVLQALADTFRGLLTLVGQPLSTAEPAQSSPSKGGAL